MLNNFTQGKSGLLVLILFAFAPFLRPQWNFDDRRNYLALDQVPPGLTTAAWSRIQGRLLSEYFEFAALRSSDIQVGDHFGWSVAISSDTLAVGVLAEDGGPGDPLTDAGAVYIFERDLGGPGNWGEAAILHASDAQAGDYFGAAVAISGDTLVVGAPFENGGPGNPLQFAGAVYIFERNLGGPGNWGEAIILHASDAQEGYEFGYSVALDENTLVVGALLEAGGVGGLLLYSGAAYVFERDSGGAGDWGEAAILHASDAQEEDFFGVSVSISQDTLIIGAVAEDGGAGDPIDRAGAAYIYERDQGGVNNWGEVGILHASDAEIQDYFGVSVSISGDTLVVGAYGEDGGVGNPMVDSGAAYVFERNPGDTSSWVESQILRASDGQPEGAFGWSVALSGDKLLVGAYDEVGGTGDPTDGAYIFKSDAGTSGVWEETEIIQASDGQPDDFFGRSVAVDSGTLIVGAPHEDGGEGDPLPYAGAAYIFIEMPISIYFPGVFTEP